jgi:GH24 family phage-related lysozyme (muramidase)
MGFLETAQKDLEQWEGSVSHMYKDTRGYVTVGIGFMIPSAASAKAYGFVKRDDNKAATAPEKEEEWKKINALPKGRKASAYKDSTTLDLPDGEIKKHLTEKINKFVSGIKGVYPDFDKYPDELKLALLDIAYNTGGVKGFPKMKAAIQAGKWEEAAKESHRSGPSAARNKYVYDLIIAAGKKMPATTGAK